MAALFDSAKLTAQGNQRVELYENGQLWIIDDGKKVEIKLESQASTNLFVFLHQWQDRLINQDARRDGTRDAEGLF